MSMPNPSSEWAKEEREEVLLALQGQLLEYGERHGNPVPSYVMDDITERMHLVKDADAEFLELNRAGILDPLNAVLDRFEKARASQAQ